MPVLASAPDTNRPTLLRHIRDHHDLWAIRHAPAFAEDVELNLAEAAGEGDLLLRRDSLLAEEDHAVFIVGPLDRGECLIIKRSRQVDTADLCAERCAGRDNLDRHGASSSTGAVSSQR